MINKLRIYAKSALIFTLLLICIHPIHAQNPTAILGAFEEELTWLIERVDDPQVEQIMGYDFTTGEIEEQPVVLALTGVGKVNAAIMATLILEHFQPEAVIFTGVAGGIGLGCIPGDVVVGTTTVQHDMGDMTPDGIELFGVRNPLNQQRNPIYFSADSTLLELARRAVDAVELERAVIEPKVRNPRVSCGVIATGDTFITSTPKKDELRDYLKVNAVEMEGGAVAQVCYQFNVPCLVIRALSDYSDENADADFEKYYRTAARNANRLVLQILQIQ